MKLILYIRSFFFENNSNKKAILICIYATFLLLFIFLHGEIDYIVNLYFGIPVILATYYYGLYVGVLFWLFEVVFHTTFLFLLKENYSFIYMNSRVRIAFISLFVVMYIVSFFRSIKNNLIESEKRYKQVSSELQKLNQTKDKFFSIIAHDLRGPVGSITANLDYLIQEKEGFSEQQKDELLAALHSLSTRVYNLLENLLKWALIQKNEIEIHIERINLKQQCEESIELFANIAKKKNIVLQNNILSDCYIMADRNALDTIMRNFISNALKFTNSGGIVCLSAEECEENIAIAVADSGLGMDEKHMMKLFKINENIVVPGTQGEKGTGLGLILCNELVRKCNGKIMVESKPKKGSTFKVCFPKKVQM